MVMRYYGGQYILALRIYQNYSNKHLSYHTWSRLLVFVYLHHIDYTNINLGLSMLLKVDVSKYIFLMHALYHEELVFLFCLRSAHLFKSV